MKRCSTYLADALKRVFSLSLVALLLFISGIQYLHHHPTSHKHASKTAISKSEHCKICDHFHHHRGSALKSDLILVDLSVNPAAPIQGGIYLLREYAGLIQHGSNKGPPSLV